MHGEAEPGAWPRWEDKDSNQGSQSTRGGIGLVHRRLVRTVFGKVSRNRNSFAPGIPEVKSDAACGGARVNHHYRIHI